MARRMTAAERNAQRATVVELRSVRVKFAEIGKRLTPPVSAQRAHQIYEQALAANPLTAIQVDEHRLEALELADVAVRQLMAIGTAAANSAGRGFLWAGGVIDPGQPPRTVGDVRGEGYREGGLA